MQYMKLWTSQSIYQNIYSKYLRSGTSHEMIMYALNEKFENIPRCPELTMGAQNYKKMLKIVDNDKKGGNLCSFFYS